MNSKDAQTAVRRFVHETWESLDWNGLFGEIELEDNPPKLYGSVKKKPTNPTAVHGHYIIDVISGGPSSNNRQDQKRSSYNDTLEIVISYPAEYGSTPGVAVTTELSNRLNYLPHDFAIANNFLQNIGEGEDGLYHYSVVVDYIYHHFDS